MKFFPLALLTVPAVVLGCGGFFYPAPPTLDHFPERLPVKTMSELLRDANPPAGDAATFAQIDAETRAIAAAAGTAPREELLARIDQALARNRAGDYRKRFANCLHDLRDLLSQKSAPAAAVSAYAARRTEAMDWDDGLFLPSPASPPWTVKSDETAEETRNWQKELKETADFLEAEVGKAGPELKPHWLIQAGAWQFKHAEFHHAARFFQRVIDEAPEHPRAEVARLMLARARMEEWAAAKEETDHLVGPTPQELSLKFLAATQAFDAYLKAHPEGRFAPDIPGWRAGMERENGNLAAALSLFLVQMDQQAHPEIVRRALRECEACLDAFDGAKVEESAGEEGRGLPLDEIARRPLAALAVVYHFLDAESRHDFNDLLIREEALSVEEMTERYLLPMLRVRRAGRKVLPALAAAVIKQKETYAGAVWRPRYLAILAWAASEVGDQGQAIRICDLAGPALEGSDDLLLARAVALQRDGQFAAAIAGFRKLQDQFPDSPLNAETHFRVATALRDQHESGAAAVELLRIFLARAREEQGRVQSEEGQPAPASEVPALHLDAEITQWADTLLQFAPLPELARGLAVPNLEPPIARRLRAILRQRHLAREEFAAAQRFAEPPPNPTAPEGEDPNGASAELWEGKFRPADKEGGYPVALVEEAWASAVTNLIRLTRESAGAAIPEARAPKLFALAEAWAALRGRLTLPSMDDFGICNNEPYEIWTQRQRNAQVAGIAAAASAQELEGRDELLHAQRYYLQAAAAAPGSPLAAQALWRANEAERALAELSPWSAARAFETNATERSRQLHRRLLRECPHSPEAKGLSVWWTFPLPAENAGGWMPGQMLSTTIEPEVAAALQLPAGRPAAPEGSGNPQTFDQRLQELSAQAATWDVPKLLAELARIGRDFQAEVESGWDARIINHVDDLTLFLQEPGLTAAARGKYFAARLSHDPPALDDPDLQPWVDYLSFLALVRERPLIDNPETGERRFRPMSDRMREFLEKFPKSRKREAALARLAIATVREFHGHAGVADSAWPESPIFGGYKKMAIEGGQAFDGPRVFGALDAYEREFPKGRYAAEMRLWRGAAALDRHDWKTAVSLLGATLDDSTKPDLHLDAALNLATVFMQLLDEPANRPEILAVLAENPSAQKRLRQLMASETLGSRLRCLEGYLDERFAHTPAHP